MDELDKKLSAIFFDYSHVAPLVNTAPLLKIRKLIDERVAAAENLRDKHWCDALEYSGTGEKPDLDSGFEEDGPVKTRAALIEHGPLVDRMVAAAVLQEAEWWEHLVDYADPHHSDEPKEGCMYCRRLAELRAAPRRGKVEEALR